jgi:ubiquinone/menaquinone biosynthesis C-methylase UbiE
MQNILLQMLEIYELPGQSFWRAHELLKLKELKDQIGFHKPVLEIGCGDGVFSSLVFDRIDDAIDINPRAIERARKLTNFYERLHSMDAREMQFADSVYRTVFANCVLEHIPSVDHIIKSSYRVLAQDGVFVTTVPLVEMNDFLLFKSAGYAELRRRQLSHANLLTMGQWQQMFTEAGFSQVKFFPYLIENQCHLWDTMDFPISFGFRRFTVGNGLRLMSRALPKSIIRRVRLSIARTLARHAPNPENNVPCAAAIVAFK